MERKIKKEAWEILNKDEQVALSLSLGHGKSTWESGEIMSKAHFKYLEISKRAKVFLEIFTNHLEKYPDFFPKDSVASFDFKEYLILTMFERKNISTSVVLMDNRIYRNATNRKKLIKIELDRLKKSHIAGDRAIHNIIFEFDRWNNFRILPRELQLPSAFKRRNKNKHKKHIKNLISLPQFSVITLIDKFSYSGKKKMYFMPIVSKYLEGYFKIIPIKSKPLIVKKLTKIGLFIFKEYQVAEEYASIIKDYSFSNEKSCKMGQKFWPKFRELISYAINYKDLENINQLKIPFEEVMAEEEGFE